jgi:hypothetical protein
MKFPITREDLQAFDYARELEEQRKDEVQKQLAQILEQLCKEFKQGMLTNSKEKRFIWRQLYLVVQANGSGRMQSIDDYLTQFIDKLKEVFVDCDIIVDPLKTYLIIDWS